MPKRTIIRIGLAGALAAFALSGCEEDSVGFDASRWHAEAGNATGPNARGAMVASLNDAGVRPGVTRDAVRKLLGEPDSFGPRADVYFLGRSATGPSFDTYRVDYDAAGVVTAAQVVRN